MISYETYNICGCFEYSNLSYMSFVDFIESISRNQSYANGSFLDVKFRLFDQKLAIDNFYNSFEKQLFQKEDLLNSTFVSFDFLLIDGLMCSAYFSYFSETYCELSICILNEELEKRAEADKIIQKIYKLFVENLNPVKSKHGVNETVID